MTVSHKAESRKFGLDAYLPGRHISRKNIFCYSTFLLIMRYSSACYSVLMRMNIYIKYLITTMKLLQFSWSFSAFYKVNVMFHNVYS